MGERKGKRRKEGAEREGKGEGEGKGRRGKKKRGASIRFENGIDSHPNGFEPNVNLKQNQQEAPEVRSCWHIQLLLIFLQKKIFLLC